MKLDFSVAGLGNHFPVDSGFAFPLIQRIKAQQKIEQLSNLQLAKKMAYKNTNKTLRRLDHFEKTGELPEEHLLRVCEILDINLKEIKRIKAQCLAHKYADMHGFIKNFNEIWRHRHFIVRHPAYANISFPGLYFSAAYLTVPRYNLGLLLQHYMNHEWSIEHICCDRFYIIGGGGSPLSGRNTCHGFCCQCRQHKSLQLNSFGILLKAHKKLKPMCTQQTTGKTISDLLKDFSIKN